MQLPSLLTLLFLSHTTSLPTPSLSPRSTLDCTNPVTGLTPTDCTYMSSLSLNTLGHNSPSPNDPIWLSDSGPHVIQFTNAASAPLILLMWLSPTDTYTASFLQVSQPYISYSLARGQQVDVSVGNGISGAWAGLYMYPDPGSGNRTGLTRWGQVNNTWGEFTAPGDGGTVGVFDVSREVNMLGNHMLIAGLPTENGGCVSDSRNDTCVFRCKEGRVENGGCGQSGTYELVNCEGAGRNVGTWGGDASGGCDFRGAVGVWFFD